MTVRFPPGPKISFMGLDFVDKFKNNPLETAASLRKEFGDVVYLKLGPYDWYVFFHPDHIKEILVTGAKHFGRTEKFQQVMGSVDGKGLVVSDGDFWLKQRRIIQPTFHHEMLNEYATIILEKTELFASKWQIDKTISLADEMTNITLSIAAKLFLDVDVQDKAKKLGDAVTTISKELYREFTEVVPVPDFMNSGLKEKKKAVAVVDNLIAEGIDRQLKTPSSRKTVLSMLLAARDESGKEMDKKQIRDEAITLFNAGHDSTAAALSWCWYLLMKHPDHYDRMLKEIDELPKDAQPLEALQRTPFVTQIAKETLRLYPPAWTLPRQAMQEADIGEYKIPKDAILNTFAYITQRDERFFSEPDTFNPARFKEENEHQLHPFAYFPFGAGPRSCIGKELAMMEIHLILVALSRRFKFELKDSNKTVTPNPLISLEPKDSLATFVRSRN